MSAPIIVERWVPAPPNVVYRYFTSAEWWARWQGTGATLDPRPGGAIHIRMAGSNEAGARGHFVELVPDRRLVFTWGWIDAPFGEVPPGSTLVEVDLIVQGDGTIIRLTHRQLPAGLEPMHEEGWRVYLDRLAARVAGDDPGPDPSLSER
ncbi:MAG TPA: SRPBCC domain-containing protein [Dehalococcoidia bacterium]|nr:SRPBCC domain-containing protein [Dehalococcoidia bacterium]